MKYQNLNYFLNKIDGSNVAKCKKLFLDFKERLEVSPGSFHKHQAWKGGYIHHLEETMNLGQMIYNEMNKFRKLPFSFSDIVLVLFLHDLEKPFRYVPVKKEFGKDIEKHNFIKSLIKKYKIKLNTNHKNALRYIHGEGDEFHRTKRIQKPLAAFVHCLDTMSARIWFDEPKRSFKNNYSK